MGWKRKTMRLAEWHPLQEQFGRFHLATGGNSDLAMFCVSVPGEEMTTIYVHSQSGSEVEAMSPGGWESSERPSGKHVALLVGNASAWERLGVSRDE